MLAYLVYNFGRKSGSEKRSIVSNGQQGATPPTAHTSDCMEAYEKLTLLLT